MPDTLYPIEELERQNIIFRLEYLINDTSRIRRALMDQVFRPLSITRSQWMVLSALSRGGPQGMMQADLARLLEITKAPVGGLIERLEATGHVTRSPDPRDRRVKRVVITRKGHETLDRMVEVNKRINQRLYGNHTALQQRLVEDILFDLKQNMKALLDEFGGAGKDEDFDQMEHLVAQGRMGG